MKWTKIIIITLYTLIVVCIGFATIIEKYYGTTFVSNHLYGAWWFSALWALLTVVALAYIIKQRLYKRIAVMLLHLSFVVILAGALTTHLFARSGIVRLRTNVPEMIFIDKENKVEHLPFSLTLKEFRIINYPGTDAPLDYQSVIQRGNEEVLVSMNNIGNIDGYRLFQQSYDIDGEGVTLGVSYDPYGIAITYLGYLLLLVGIIATLLSRHTQMRALYRKAMRPMVLLFTLHSSLFTATAQPLPVVDADIAHRMGTINVLYNNRICPLNTVATDFTMKLTGSASWHGYSADEVFFSWMIYYMPWEKELLLNNSKTKGADERKVIVEMFYSGQFTKIFPYPLTSHLLPLTSITWYSPGSQVLPREIPVKEQFFIKQSMDFLTEAIVTGQRDRAIEIIAKIKLFQHEMIGDVLPSESSTKTEIFYNVLRSQKWPVFLALTLSLLLCICLLFMSKPSSIVHYSLFTLHLRFPSAWSALVAQRTHTSEQWPRNHALHGMGAVITHFPAIPEIPHHFRLRPTYCIVLFVGIPTCRQQLTTDTPDACAAVTTIVYSCNDCDVCLRPLCPPSIDRCASLFPDEKRQTGRTRQGYSLITVLTLSGSVPAYHWHLPRCCLG